MIESIVIGVIIGIVIAYILITFIYPKLLKSATDQLLMIAGEKLSSEKQDIKTDLENKKSVIEDIAKRIKDDLEKTKDKLETAERDRIGSFRELKQELEGQRKITEQLSATTDNLRKVLSNNQLRGQFGEQVAEELLMMSGFVKGVDYDFNKEQKDTESRPDFTIHLPNKTKINVDAKFPYQNLQKMAEAQDASTKKECLKLFERDIKEKVKQVTTRNYINPEENTVDFVIMFIPNEMIFSFIYDKMNDLWHEAMRQKVVFAGPFSFTAILRLIRQAHENFKYQKNVQKIIGYIKAFEIEFSKYNEEFEKIGEKIHSLTEQYNKVETTRTNQLVRSIDKVKIENSHEEKLLTE